MNSRGMIATVVALVLATTVAGGFVSAAAARADEVPSERTPPRLSFIDGEVSFWRPGVEDWTAAHINTPLAPGDALYTGARANLEIQIGTRAFLRAGEETQLGLDNQEKDFLQFRVTAGHVSVDLRSLPYGFTLELDTPNAAITIERTGYYRLDVDSDTTTFITRRGGRAVITPIRGEPAVITPSEQLVVEGVDAPTVESYVAPDLDVWDQWNYDRTDQMIDAISARYVSSGVYGLDTLDRYGSWRVVPTYGPVWVPDGVARGWVPYSTGSWVWDPFYGWTWVDTAVWGWAPYHYGRWVYTTGFWAWAPGPIVATPFYAPAMVAFFSGRHFGVHVGIGAPVGWVALGWGEPLIPWWGSTGFVGRPCWRGWGGPRVVNRVVIQHNTIVNVQKINVFENAHRHGGVVMVKREHFGRGPVTRERLKGVDVARLRPVHEPLPIKPGPASLSPVNDRGRRPPERTLNRPVVATRPPHDTAATLRAGGVPVAPDTRAVPPRLVPAPQRGAVRESRRPPFGQREAPERARPPQPRRFESVAPPSAAAPARRPAGPPDRAPADVPEPGRVGAPERAPARGERAPVEGAPAVRAPGEFGRPERPAAPVPAVPPETSRQRAPARVERAPVERAPRVAPPQQPVAPAQPPDASRERAPARAERAPAVQVPREVQRPEPPAAPAPAAPREMRRQPSRALPGEPANRLYPARPEVQWPRRESPPSVQQPSVSQPSVGRPPSVGQPSQPGREFVPRHERIRQDPRRGNRQP